MAARRQLGEQALRDDLAPRQVREAGRVREALQPEQLSGVGVEELLPEPRRPRMRSGRIDRLAVVGSVDAVAGDGDRDPRGRELLDVGEVEVVPVDHDRRLAGGDRLRRRLDREEVARVLEPLEEVDARPDVAERAAVRDRGREHAGDGRARRERAAVQGDPVPVIGLEQVGPRLRHVRDDRAVDAERDDAVVVADPEAAAVLHRARDGSEVAVEVLRVEALVGAVDRERRPDVEDVRSALVALERPDRLVLLGGRAVRVVVRQLEAVLLLEGVHDLAVVRPVGRQRDRVDLTFLLRLLEDVVELILCRAAAASAPLRANAVPVEERIVRPTPAAALRRKHRGAAHLLLGP